MLARTVVFLDLINTGGQCTEYRNDEAEPTTKLYPCADFPRKINEMTTSTMISHVISGMIRKLAAGADDGGDSTYQEYRTTETGGITSLRASNALCSLNLNRFEAKGARSSPANGEETQSPKSALKRADGLLRPNQRVRPTETTPPITARATPNTRAILRSLRGPDAQRVAAGWRRDGYPGSAFGNACAVWPSEIFQGTPASR